jgi:hypothetical protein
VQNYVVFTFQENLSNKIVGASHIVAIRGPRYKLAKYYDPRRSRRGLVVYEMYDLRRDPTLS